MQAVLNIQTSEIDERLLHVIRELLSRDVEVTLKNADLEFEDFDSSVSLADVMEQFESAGYSNEFLADLKAGFETSEVYGR